MMAKDLRKCRVQFARATASATGRLAGSHTLASIMLQSAGRKTGRVVMDDTGTSNERMTMTAVQPSPVIPAHPNLVEVVALLEDPGLRGKDRTLLKRVLHDTVHLVKKQDDRTRYGVPGRD